MPRKKIVKEPIEKVKDEMVLEIIEDSSDEEDTALPPPPQDNAIRVSQGNKVLSEMSVQDIKDDLTPKPQKKKRVLSEEQKAKMKEGRERKKAEKALQAGKKENKATPIITSNRTPPPTPPQTPVPVNEEEPPRWFKAYLASQRKAEPEPEPEPKPQKVKQSPEPAKKPRGRPKGKKDSKPRVTKKQSTVMPEAPVAQPKPSMRFI
jgi:hypothetical protein